MFKQFINKKVIIIISANRMWYTDERAVSYRVATPQKNRPAFNTKVNLKRNQNSYQNCI